MPDFNGPVPIECVAFFVFTSGGLVSVQRGGIATIGAAGVWTLALSVAIDESQYCPIVGFQSPVNNLGYSWQVNTPTTKVLSLLQGGAAGNTSASLMLIRLCN